MPIRVEVNGEDFNGFTDITVSRDIQNITGEFTIRSTALPGNLYPVRVGDKCQIFIDETQIIDGFVGYCEGGYGADTHDFVFQGWDKTKDLVDSTLPGNITYITPISLKTAIERVIETLGSDIKVFQRTDIQDFDQSSVVSGELGESFFEFIDRYCRKRQVLATGDGKGNIILTRASNEVISTLISNRIGSEDNNIKSARFRIDNTNRFHRYQVFCQGNASYEEILLKHGYEVPESIASKQSNPIIDNAIRRTRVMNLVAESSMTIQEAEARALWQTNISRAKSIQYQVELQGFNANADGEIWQTNKLVSVVDDFSDIDASLLISNVLYNFSLDGSSTRLELISSDAFTLEPFVDKQTNRAQQLVDEYFARQAESQQESNQNG